MTISNIILIIGVIAAAAIGIYYYIKSQKQAEVVTRNRSG